jgi:hypothetical protein
MPEDKKLAREHADADIRHGLDQMKQIAERQGARLDVAGISDDGKLVSDTLEATDETVFVMFAIGTRDLLTKKEADRFAGAWREASQRLPNSIFSLHIAGYDDDPRALWEFPEVTRYVRRFARTAGLDTKEAVMKWLDPNAPGFLAACGVFGESMRQEALSSVPGKTTAQ